MRGVGGWSRGGSRICERWGVLAFLVEACKKEVSAGGGHPWGESER